MLSERLESWLRQHVLLVDGAMAFALVLACVLPYATHPLTATISFFLVAPLALRRHRPVIAAGVVFATAFVQWLTVSTLMPNPILGDVGVLMAIYAAVAYGPRRVGWVALLIGLLGAGLGGLRWPLADPRTADHWFAAGVFAAGVVPAWAFGRLRAVRREQLEALRERARLLEVERDQRARLAVTAERARIARDMHDVVAHSLAVIIAQADGGRYAAAAQPEAAATALATIGETGRRALAEMRRLLAVLREEAAPGDEPSGDPDRVPQPAIDDLPDLLGQVRAGGLDVRMHQEGEVTGIGPGTGLVVYRVVQEALTNVLKHAGAQATAEVTIRRNGTVVEVEVLDDGRGAGAPAASSGIGQGLLGMRERVTAYGGTVQTGPRRGGGFAVRARIPLVAG
jgi:signal transduction histidine kinase